MRVNHITEIWKPETIHHIQDVPADQKSAVVDRVVRVGRGQVRKIAVNLQGLNLLDTEGPYGEATKLQLVGARGRDGVLYKPGYPEVPAVRFFVSAARQQDIQVKLGNTIQLHTPLKLGICQPSVIKTDDPNLAGVEPVDFQGTYPPKCFDIVETGTVNGEKQFMVSIYPVSLTSDGTASVITNFDVRAKCVKERQRFAVAPKTFAFVVGERFADSPSLAEYKALKEELGFQVEMIVVGRDATTPDEIRTQLQRLFHNEETDLRYAMLIGDYEDVPAKASQHISGVTDHYYRAIDTAAYETDINGPDIGVGRVPVKNEEELAAVMAKFTRYSKRDFSSHDWQGKASFIGTDDQWQIAEATHNHVIDNFTKPAGMVGSFPSPVQAGGDQLYAITHHAGREDLKRALAEGRAYINYSGHGGETLWAGPEFTQGDIRDLQHPDALPMVVSNACVTGNFQRDEAFAETWIRHDRGAIFFWGSVDSTYWDEDDVLERAMAEHMFTGDRTFSEITQHALAEVWRYYGGEGRSKYYQETYTNFGDPSLRPLLNREVDSTPPATPSDFRLEKTDPTKVTVALTAVGDDGMEGRASSYEVRISDKPIVATNPGAGEIAFDDAIPVPVGTPAAAGENQILDINLEPSEQARELYVAIRALDESGNASGIVPIRANIPPCVVVFDGGAESFHVDSPWAQVNVDGRVGVWSDSPTGNYGNQVDAGITTKSISLGHVEKPELRFDAKYSLEEGYDYGYVEVADVTNLADGADIQWNTIATLAGEQDWQQNKIDLAGFAGKDIKLRFVLRTDQSEIRDGIYIHNIRILGEAMLQEQTDISRASQNGVLSAAEAKTIVAGIRRADEQGYGDTYRQDLGMGMVSCRPVTNPTYDMIFGEDGVLPAELGRFIRECEGVVANHILSSTEATRIRRAYVLLCEREPQMQAVAKKCVQVAISRVRALAPSTLEVLRNGNLLD